eukprot:CAMPEP_0176447550 /NCGR_PEP_ID=MMETSP0127-20121128/25124_1 /TAXON_ID=938130 /ORGANISM="Platyophrya macrostoma, Strain WH" /LENGTH=44 /DNA_ID= /DNA_START= /DNA_END= /DNA_ORIENTATION=
MIIEVEKTLSFEEVAKLAADTFNCSVEGVYFKAKGEKLVLKKPT